MSIDRSIPAAVSGVAAGESDAAVLDRVLLYLRGMDVSPVQSLELALESFRRLEAGSIPLSMPSAMKELHALLRENKLRTAWINGSEPPRPSMPPMNRCSMVAEKMEFLWPRFLRRPRGRCSGQSEKP